VLKKTLKAVAALTLITGSYFAYVHLFALVVEQLRAVHRSDKILFPVHDSKSKRVSISYAKAAFGRDHWSADPELAFRYYNAERGYWMYAKEWERIVEENGVRYDGKRMRLKPFAFITKSRDGTNTKTITSNVATIDLNEPLSFNLNPDGEALKVKHAYLEPNVQIRDDKSTPDDPSDDMRIGPLTTVEYDEPTQQIKTEINTQVVIQDPDILTTGDGMVIQLRKVEGPRIAGASSGFEGAERLDLLKNVHVVIHDVGKSGILPGSTQAPVAAKRSAGVTAELASGTRQKQAKATAAEAPTPLDVRCDAKMQVYLPKPQVPIDVGPSAPPAPTVAQFERNVVVLRGPIDDRPDQLTCDALRLDLVPGEKPAPDAAPVRVENLSQSGPVSAPASTHAAVAANAANQRASAAANRANARKTTSAAVAGAKPGSASDSNTANAPESPSSARVASDSEKRGLFGDLTLHRAHATGHVVWLSLPTQGIKIRCNELIHLRQAPYKPDMTYFRGDFTRPLELVKIDVIKEEGPDKGKISSVTHVRTVDATLIDKHHDMDTADVVAHGPGRLETQPDRDQPVERIAIWQDKLIVQNVLGNEGQLVRKTIDLTGNRPCFIDKLKETSLDSALLIRVWLKPKSARGSQHEALSSGRTAGRAASDKAVAATAAGTGQTLPATPAAHEVTHSAEANKAGADLGGGNLQMERLLAVRDVHMLAPTKTMTARQRLDAEFVEAPATPAPAATPAAGDAVSSSVRANPEAAKANNGSSASPAHNGAALEQEPTRGESSGQVASGGQAAKKPAEPPMVGSAEQIWASLDLEPSPNHGTGATKPAAATGGSSARTTTASTRRSSAETKATIRKVWMFGNVALHQDPGEGKSKGQEASGEALYLDNRGENRATTYVYQRDPTEKGYLPGPLPPAWVEDEDKTVKAAGIIKMNQETDQFWVEGPGTFVQLPAETAAAPAALPGAGAIANAGEGARSGAPESRSRTVTTSLVSGNDAPTNSFAPEGQAPPSSRKTAGVRPGTEKVPSTIQFSERMEFIGRTKNPQGEPAGEADFHGIVRAEMPDALLYCEEKMIAYTDRVVPLAELGKMSRAQSKPQRSSDPMETADDAADADSETEKEPEPQLALIQCFRNAVGITRTVDRDARVLMKKETIVAQDMLTYDRRTGDFSVPGEGSAYLYDRSDNSSRAPGLNLNDAKNNSNNAAAAPAQRTITPASDRGPKRSSPAGETAAATPRSTEVSPPPTESTESKAGAIPPLVLTQIHFKNGMRGVYVDEGRGGVRASRWSEFFGDVQSARAKVTSDRIGLNFDKLPSDAIFLTGQTLRVRSEPPPVGSPRSAAARDYLKAWEKAYAWSSDKTVQADVITYDSEKDLIHAIGEGGRLVIYAQQHATGQPSTLGSAKAILLNPKTGALHTIDNASIQLIDKNTGVRPAPAMPTPPETKKKKPPRRPFRVPSNNMERRGFTGS
jgi:hypothetical protein